MYITDDHSRRLDELKAEGMPKSMLVRHALDMLFNGDTVEKLREAFRLERDSDV